MRKGDRKLAILGVLALVTSLWATGGDFSQIWVDLPDKISTSFILLFIFFAVDAKFFPGTKLSS